VRLIHNPMQRGERPEQSPDGTMTLTEHLGELRQRIIRAALAILVGMIAIMAFYDQVLGFLLEPYDRLCKSDADYCGLASAGGSPSLVITDPVEGLATRFRIAMYGGLLIALPVIMWQIWKFVVPALKANEKRYAIPFIASSVSLFLLGSVIAYLTLEKALQFLIAWAGHDVESLFQVSKYVRLVTLMAFAFGIGFQFPILLVFLQLIDVLQPQQLMSVWRYAIVGIVVAAAVITPSGDPISMTALAVPMLVLYFASAGIGFLVQRRRRRRAEQPAAA
jgi:sec-independent protein translocase protein TatC